MLESICTYFFTFIIYSVFGWIMETLLYVFRDKKFVKRGFLFGPLCPIYGTGAVVLTLLFYGKVNNIFLLFLWGFLVCGVLEYFTHFVMEKLFHAVWWDYSSRRFNINGRVYLNGLIYFGIGTVLIIKIAQPLVFKLIDAMPDNLLYILCFIFYTVLVIDVATTVADLKGIVRALKKAQQLIIDKGQNKIDNADEKVDKVINDVKTNEKIMELTNWLKNDNALMRRIHEKYPDFKLSKYKQVLDIIRDKGDEEKQRTDVKVYGTGDLHNEDKDE